VKADSGKPSLTWKAVEGAVKYEVYRATSKSGTYTKMYTTTGTSYINSTAKPGTTYYYKVRALGTTEYANSAYSTIKSITCDCAAPVVSITVKADCGKPSLTWKAVEGAVKYEVYRATSKSGTYTKMYTTTGTSYVNSTAKPGTTYYYKVRALGTTEYANSAYSTIKSITCDCARPVVTITTNSAGKPYLDWDAVDGAVKYEIWRATSSTGTYTKMWTTTNSYYTNTSAVSGTIYYYKVVALGSTSYANSAESNVVSIKCK
jgi:fibronectin type 3 domain-containing protein